MQRYAVDNLDDNFGRYEYLKDVDILRRCVLCSLQRESVWTAGGRYEVGYLEIFSKVKLSRGKEAHSSSGLGHLPLKEEITGSNPVCATNKHLIAMTS